jgi:hypothetical protein
VPDSCLLRACAPREQIIQTAPLLAVEVLSPEDRIAEMQDRVDGYLSMDVSAVWVIDPKKRRAWIHTSLGVEEARQGDLKAPGITVNLRELFDKQPSFPARKGPRPINAVDGSNNAEGAGRRRALSSIFPSPRSGSVSYSRAFSRKQLRLRSTKPVRGFAPNGDGRIVKLLKPLSVPSRVVSRAGRQRIPRR